jgi:alpha-amylase
VASAAGEAAYVDWYVWADENPGYRGPWNQQAWYAKGERYYYAPFWSEMPDLNYANPAVTDEMFNVMDFWLQEMGVDGFRLDAIKYVLEVEMNGSLILQDSPANRQWLAIMNEYIHRVKPEAITVGEIWDSTLVVGRYMKDESVDTAFAFDLATRAVNAARVASRRDWEKELVKLTETFGAQFSPFLSNHDMNRLMNTLDGSIEANKVAASLLLTIPGTPFLYYGEEIGMTGIKAATTDEPVRTPMQWESGDNAGFTSGTPWTDIPADTAEHNVAAQTDDPDSLLSHYRVLIQLRNAHPALRSTNLQVLNLPLGAVTAYLRWTDDEMLLVVVNTGSDPAVDYELQARESPLSGITNAEVLFGAGEVAVPQVDENGGFDGYLPLPGLAPHSTLIIKLS